MNHGYIHASIPTSALVYGGRDADYLVADRNWRPFLPEFESQLGKDFETMACVSFSALNCVETLLNKKLQSVFNFSDRFTARMSNTTNRGNTLWNVMQSIENDGFINETRYPNNTKTFAEYYQDVPQEIIVEAKGALLRFKVIPEFVPANPDIMFEALGYAPLQIAMYAYAPKENGIVQRTMMPPSHAIMIYNAKQGEYFELFDHYNKNNPFVKVAWDSLFWGAVLYDIQKLPNMQFKDNHIYQLIDPPGGFYMFAREKLMKIETPDHVLAWLFRAGENWYKQTSAITKADMEDVDIYNFKGEKI